MIVGSRLFFFVFSLLLLSFSFDFDRGRNYAKYLTSIPEIRLSLPFFSVSTPATFCFLSLYVF